MTTNTYEGGLAEQSVKHYYAGSTETPKRQSYMKGKKKMSCKKKKPGKK